VHDGVTGKLIRTLRSTRKLPKTECNDASLLFSPDGEHLIATTYMHDLFKRPNETEGWATLPTRVFNLASGREAGRFYCNPETTSQALRHSCEACSPEGRLLAVAETESATIRLIEIASGKVCAQFTGHRHGVHAMAFSPDGKRLASGGEDGNAFLWDVIGPP
jgi:WD40 repeat protein